MKKLLLILCALSFTFCVDKQHIKYLDDTILHLRAENDSLRSEIDSYRNAPDNLLANIKNEYNSKNYTQIAELVERLKTYHPAAKEIAQAEQYEKKATNAILAARQREIEAAKKAERERLRAVNKLRKKKDDISGITWYENPYFVHYNNSNLCSLYIGKEGTNVWLRLKMSYYGDSWIFFDKAYLSYQGNTYEVPFNEYEDKKTDNSTSTWEWIDISVSNSLLLFLQNALKTNTIKMRLSGKYTKDRVLSQNEVKGLRDVLLAYEVLKDSTSVNS